MVYVAGTFANAPTPAPSLATAIRNALSTHPNWTLIETYRQSTYDHEVWRCSGAGNAAGADFYIGVVRHTDPAHGFLYWEAFEQYNATTHQYTRPVPYFGSNTMVVQPNFTADETPRTLNATDATQYRVYSIYRDHPVAAVNGVMDYWIKVTANGLFVMSRVGTTVTAYYLGLYETFVPNPTVNDPVPLLISRLNNVASAYSSLSNTTYSTASRAPFNSTSVARWNIFSIRPPAFSMTSVDYSCVWTYPGYYQTDTALSDLIHGAPLACRLAVLVDVGNSGTYTPAQVGYLRGLWRDILALRMGSGATSGDTIVINGSTYLAVGNGLWINTQAA